MASTMHLTEEVRAYDRGTSCLAAGSGAGRLGELEQVGGGILVELQRPGDGQQHLVGRMPVAALLEADVVVGADPGEERDLLAPQARDPAVALAGHSRGVGARERSADAQIPAQGVGIYGGWHASSLSTAHRPG